MSGSLIIQCNLQKSLMPAGNVPIIRVEHLLWNSQDELIKRVLRFTSVLMNIRFTKYKLFKWQNFTMSLLSSIVDDVSHFFYVSNFFMRRYMKSDHFSNYYLQCSIHSIGIARLMQHACMLWLKHDTRMTHAASMSWKTKLSLGSFPDNGQLSSLQKHPCLRIQPKNLNLAMNVNHEYILRSPHLMMSIALIFISYHKELIHS